MNNDVHIDLLVSSERVKLQRLSDFKVGMKISCDGEKSVPFDISNTKLFINGKPCVVWDLTVQNGTTINLNILCGKPAILEWPLGKGMFTNPGKYILELKWQDISRIKKVMVEE